MVRRKFCRAQGQSTTEFILLISILTVIGVALMKDMIGADKQSGAVNSMAATGRDRIQNDPD